MLEKLAKSTARFFVLQNTIESEHEEIYAYGMEILLSTIANGLIALLIAIITNTFIPSLLFLAVFVIMRKSAGGYHAKTHGGCMAILICVQIGFIGLIHCFNYDFIIVYSISAMVISIISVFLCAPVEHPNKPINDEDKLRLRRKSIIYILLISIINLLCLVLGFTQFALYISCGIFVSTGAMIAEKIVLLKEFHDE